MSCVDGRWGWVGVGRGGGGGGGGGVTSVAWVLPGPELSVALDFREGGPVRVRQGPPDQAFGLIICETDALHYILL